MTDAPRFNPFFPSHAIERCTATLLFKEAVPEKPFNQIIEIARKTAQEAGLEAIATAHVGFQVDFATGRVSSAGSGAPPIFYSPDRATSFVLAANSLTLQTAHYIRWQPFIGLVEEVIFSMTKHYCKITDVFAVQLEYSDRFFWSGTWENLDWTELLQSDSGFLASHAPSNHRQWHSHAGWFDDTRVGGGGPRRLINVNIEQIEATVVPSKDGFLPIITPEAASVIPSISVITLLRDQAHGSGVIQEGAVPDLLENLHKDGKTVLGLVVRPEMAVRIGLDGGGI